MVKISKTIELTENDVESIYVENIPDIRHIFNDKHRHIINLKHKLDYPVGVMYEIHVDGMIMRGYLTNDGKRIIEY